MKLKTYLPLGLFSIFLFSSLAYAQPHLTETQALKLINQQMQHERLYWTPFPLPYEIPQTNTGKDAKLLAALAKHGLLSKETLEIEVGEPQQNTKPQYELYWQYRYKPLRQSYEREGFYYGKPKLLRIKQISEPVPIKQGLYVLVDIEWMVSDLQAWTKDTVFHTARTLRRSQNSASQPFEEKYHFEYLPDSEDWQIWNLDSK